MFTDILLHNMGLFPGIVDTISFEAILTSQKSPSKLKREKSVKSSKENPNRKGTPEGFIPPTLSLVT